MSFTPTENLPQPLLVPEVEQQTLIYWPGLSVDEKAFVAAYIENGYSLLLACEALKCSKQRGAALLRKVPIRKAIAEVQEELDGIDFLNEKWVKAQLLRLYPMAIGDEPVPVVTNTGEEMEVRKFYPDIAMRVLEYVAPKAQKTTLNINVNNVSKLTDEQLEQIAAKGMGRVVSEQ